jgi:tRNA (uracil-5-)-methyltransferase
MPLSQIKPEQYEQQLEQKAERIRRQFAEFNPPELAVFSSPPLHYRMRAEFKLWHQDNDSYYVMFRPEQPKEPHRVDQFPVASRIINQIMEKLRTAILDVPVLRERLFQVEFLSTQTDEVLITLIYHKKLDSAWEIAARQLQQQLDCQIMGRARKQKVILHTDFVTETLNVGDKAYQYQQVEGSFTQPNAKVNEKMLSWALEQSSDLGGDLVELYCGNGNFTAVLAQNFDRVLATEISKTSVRSALYNFEHNSIENVTIARMSSEEFSAALKGERSFRRLKDIDIESYQFSTVLVDPPRAGLDKGTEELVSRFDNILYISCNPNTLHDNLSTLCKSHRIEQFAIFDQFPYTDHIEVGVKLSKHQEKNHD